MKQGTGNRQAGDQKVEPRSTAINPGGVGNIGLAQGSHAEEGDFTPRITPMNAGRGFLAPGIATTSNKSGSQGKY